jgi:hypothetical protein
MEVDRTHAEEAFLGHRETGFNLEPPRTRQKPTTEKKLEKNGGGGS